MIFAQVEMSPTPSTTADLLWWIVLALCSAVSVLFGMLVKQQVKYVSDLTGVNTRIDTEKQSLQVRLDEEKKRLEAKWDQERSQLAVQLAEERKKNEQYLLTIGDLRAKQHGRPEQSGM